MSVISLGVLLVVSVVFAEPHQSDLKLDLELETMEGWSSADGMWNVETQTGKFSAPPKWQKNPILCCTCQDVMKISKAKIDLKMLMIRRKFCALFIRSVEKKCLKHASKLKDKILKSLFPGKTPRETCRRSKFCLY